MRLKNLTINRAQPWEKEKGFIGKLTTDSPESEISIRLDDEACREILKLAAKGIRGAAGETALFLSQESDEALLLENNDKN